MSSYQLPWASTKYGWFLIVAFGRWGGRMLPSPPTKKKKQRMLVKKKGRAYFRNLICYEFFKGERKFVRDVPKNAAQALKCLEFWEYNTVFSRRSFSSFCHLRAILEGSIIWHQPLRGNPSKWPATFAWTLMPPKWVSFDNSTYRAEITQVAPLMFDHL